jgi:hypothetical protein
VLHAKGDFEMEKKAREGHYWDVKPLVSDLTAKGYLDLAERANQGEWTPLAAMPDPDECVRLCEAISAFWGDDVCDAPISPGAYLTEQDVPIRDLIRAAVGWRKP